MSADDKTKESVYELRTAVQLMLQAQTHASEKVTELSETVRRLLPKAHTPPCIEHNQLAERFDRHIECIERSRQDWKQAALGIVQRVLAAALIFGAGYIYSNMLEGKKHGSESNDVGVTPVLRGR